MKQQKALAVVDELAGLAARADAPPLDDATQRRLLDVAMRSASVPQRPAHATLPSRTRRFAFAWPLAAAACAVLALYVWSSRPQPTPDLLRVTLPTGDRLVGTAGARFAIDELAPATRRLRLEHGAIVFDVAHVAAEQRFEVLTSSVAVIATGTVFSVDVADRATRVRVFEGSVVVVHDGRRDPLAAGQTWSSDGHPAASPAILAAGEAFARARTSAPPPTIASSHPPVAPPPASAPIAPSPPVVSPPVASPPVESSPASPRPTVARSAKAAETIATAREPVSVAVASIEDARADVAAGRYAGALAKAGMTSRTGSSGEWDLVRGDALRALHRPAEAAAAFESAARALPVPASHEAAYSAAYLRFHALHDGVQALVDLDGIDEPGSVFEERGLVLRAQILKASKREDELTAVAARYLDRFPTGSSVQLMRAIVARSASTQAKPI